MFTLPFEYSRKTDYSRRANGDVRQMGRDTNAGP